MQQRYHKRGKIRLVSYAANNIMSRPKGEIKEHVSLKITKETRELLKKYAEETNRTMSTSAEWLIEKYAMHDMMQAKQIYNPEKNL
jgi:predicted DNA-binding protein